MDYKKLLRETFKEWDPNKSLGSQTEFGSRSPCAGCPSILNPEFDSVYLCEECGDMYCDNCYDKLIAIGSFHGKSELYCNECYSSM